MEFEHKGKWITQYDEIENEYYTILNPNYKKGDEMEEKSDFDDFIKHYIGEKLNYLEGKKLYGSEVSYEILKEDYEKGYYFDNPEEEKEFITKHWDKAKEVYDYLEEEYLEFNPFENPSKFIMCMLDLSVKTYINVDSEVVENFWNDEIEITGEIIHKIKEELQSKQSNNDSTIETILKIPLQDNEHSTGGISHSEETLGEFIEEAGLPLDILHDKKKLNSVLEESGIKAVDYEYKKEESVLDAIKNKGTSSDKTGDEKSNNKEQER